jgi:hypothetical protein
MQVQALSLTVVFKPAAVGVSFHRLFIAGSSGCYRAER